MVKSQYMNDLKAHFFHKMFLHKHFINNTQH